MSAVVWAGLTADHGLESLNNKRGCLTFIYRNKLIEHLFIYGDWGVRDQSSGKFSAWRGPTSCVVDGCLSSHDRKRGGGSLGPLL